MRDGSHTQSKQGKHAAALISKIRKRIDALLGKLEKEIRTDPEVQAEIHDYILLLEHVNSSVKKMDTGEMILGALGYQG